MTITTNPVSHPAVIKLPVTDCKVLNKRNIKGNAPLTILGTVVVAVDLKLVPNCYKNGPEANTKAHCSTDHIHTSCSSILLGKIKAD